MLVTLVVGIALGAALGLLRPAASRRTTRARGWPRPAGGGPGSRPGGAGAAARPDARPRAHPGRVAGPVQPAGQRHPALDRRPAARDPVLSTALRKPQVRGRWGELHLSGPSSWPGSSTGATSPSRCASPTGRCAPTWSEPGRRAQVVVDAKVPLDAYLEPPPPTTPRSTRPTWPGTPSAAPAHRPAFRQAVLALARRDPRVRRALRPGGVLPGRRAGDRPGADPVLRLPAGRAGTPTTLIALLRTVAHGWSHEALADQAREIHRLGRELHTRLNSLTGHLDQVGRSLNAAVGHYNQAAGSLESRCWWPRAGSRTSPSPTTSSRPRGRSSPPRARWTPGEDRRAAPGRPARRPRGGWAGITSPCERSARPRRPGADPPP